MLEVIVIIVLFATKWVYVPSVIAMLSLTVLSYFSKVVAKIVDIDNIKELSDFFVISFIPVLNTLYLVLEGLRVIYECLSELFSKILSKIPVPKHLKKG
jgi:hypothetical protein